MPKANQGPGATRGTDGERHRHAERIRRWNDNSDRAQEPRNVAEKLLLSIYEAPSIEEKLRILIQSLSRARSEGRQEVIEKIEPLLPPEN
jgi:hypothetical protein